MFNLPGQQASNLSIAYSGQYSTWRGQSLFLYNFTTATWDRIDYRTMMASVSSFDLSSITSPANYVSSSGQVWLQSYSYATAGFSSYTDYLKLGVTY